MSKQMTLTQDEKTLAALAHASILLGIPTSGIGGIVAALVIWIVQKEKSAHVAAQALQALVYQAVTFVLTMIVWCCWGALYMTLIFVPLLSNPGAYEAAPPAGLWVGLALMIVPFGIWGLTILYGLYGAVRCLGGHDFNYAIIGNWLDSQN
ncbi:MAG: DUF4870 domain-containing protein [Anaerolineae bacterium]|jgi:uncharacterized Tic20 family protein